VTGVRWVRACCVGLVAVIAAWSSYWHMVHVALRYGERPEVAYVLPLSVDGVLTVAAIVMNEDRRAHRPPRATAKIAFITGLTASVAANVTAAHPTTGGRLIAAWPALALFLIVEMFTHTQPATTPATGQTHGGTSSDTANATAGEVPAEPDPAEDPPGTDRREVPHPPPEQPPTDRNNGHVPPRRNRTVTSKATRRPTQETRRLADEIMAAEPRLTRAQVADRIGISPRRLRSVLTTTAAHTRTTGSTHDGRA
jgi:hypothetical protein